MVKSHLKVAKSRAWQGYAHNVGKGREIKKGLAMNKEENKTKQQENVLYPGYKEKTERSASSGF